MIYTYTTEPTRYVYGRLAVAIAGPSAWKSLLDSTLIPNVKEATFMQLLKHTSTRTPNKLWGEGS